MVTYNDIPSCQLATIGKVILRVTHTEDIRVQQSMDMYAKGGQCRDQMCMIELQRSRSLRFVVLE
jgi:hypothetical protein